MQIHLVRNATNAIFGKKNLNIHIDQIYSLNKLALSKCSLSAKFFPVPKIALCEDPVYKRLKVLLKILFSNRTIIKVPSGSKFYLNFWDLEVPSNGSYK